MAELNELGLSFEKERMIDDLILMFFTVLDNLSDTLLDQMRSRVKDVSILDTFRKEVAIEGIEQIEIAVGSDHLKAFLDNYGTGSKMASESENPFLEEYKSKYFHEYRPDNAVTKRERGVTYVVPDWNKGYGTIERKTNPDSGIEEGTNLETLNWKDFNYKFVAKSPSFFLEHSMIFMRKVFAEELVKVYEEFPFWKYIKGGS